MATAVEKAVTELRAMIINGELSVAERITESSAATLLGMSRTPVRAALSQIESEGLLVKLEGRGYKIRPFTFRDLELAAEVRAVIEGVAAARLASSGYSEETAAAIERSIAMTEAIIGRDHLTRREIAIYQEANELFHSTIAKGCGNDFVPLSLEKISRIPIVAPGAFAEVEGMAQAELLRMTVGHTQHVIIWDAIRNGEVIRAENMMREHAGAPVRYAKLFIGPSYVDKLLEYGVLIRGEADGQD